MKANARDWTTRIRLWAAMVQGLYAIEYSLSYAAGLLSTHALEAYMVDLWVVGLVLLFLDLLSLVFHIGLGLWKIYGRNTLKMPGWELAQVLLGLIVPFFLFPQMVLTLSPIFLMHEPVNWVAAVLLAYPRFWWQFTLLMLVLWSHAQIGTHVVLRLRRWYPRVRWVIIVLLTLIPLASIGGFLKVGAALHSSLLNGTLPPSDAPHLLDANGLAAFDQIRLSIYRDFGLLYLVVVSARTVRLLLRKRKAGVLVRYSDGKSVAVAPATTLLEASRIAGVPHASICGGRGRCTTCRVKIESGMDNLSEIGEREMKALRRIGAGTGLRLACQTEILQNEVVLTLLLPAQVEPRRARGETADSIGRDVQLAVMFVDIRGFTALAEGKFPYDVVFLLNTYFQSIGKAIEAHGGTIDKFLGDGVLAYFGLNEDGRTACRNAVAACREIAAGLIGVNRQLQSALSTPLQLGVGLHFGDVVFGEVGYESKRSLTIIGDTVNTAARLEGLNKAAHSQMILSTRVAAEAGFDFTFLKLAKVEVRGKTEPIRVYVVQDISRDLPQDS